MHILLDGRIVATGGPELARTRRGRGLRRVPRQAAYGDEPRRRRRSSADFPILKREVHGKRLVYLDSRVDLAEADRGARRDGRPLPRRRTPTCTAASTRSPRRPRAPTRRPGPRSPASSTPREHRGDRLRPQRAPRRSTSSRTRGARQNLREGDVVVLSEMEHHANVVPVADARRRARRRAALDPAHRRLPPRPRPRSASCSTAPSCSRSPRCRTCSARSTTSARSPTPRTRPARSCSSTRARPCRTSPVDVQDWDADFVAFTGAQDARPVAASARCGPARELLEAMPPFLGGGEMIRDVRNDGFTTNDVPWKFEAGTPADRGGDRLRRRGRLPRRRSASTRSARHEMRAHRVRARRARRPLRRQAHDLRPARRRGARRRDLVPVRRASTPTTSRRCSTRTPSASAPATTAPSRSCACLGVPATTRASFYVYNDEADADALVEALAKAEKFFASAKDQDADARPRRPLPRDHPRPLPLAAEPRRAAGAAGAQGRGLQPAVRRRGRPLPRRRRTTRSPT